MLITTSLVNRLFLIAERQRPSIVLFDELEVLSGPEERDLPEPIVRLRNNLKHQLKTSPQGVYVFGATNLPWKVDATIGHLFHTRLYLPPPTAVFRTKILSRLIERDNIASNITPADLEEIGMFTEGYSAGDLDLVFQSALLQPVMRMYEDASFREVNIASSDPSEIHFRILTSIDGSYGTAIRYHANDTRR